MSVWLVEEEEEEEEKEEEDNRIEYMWSYYAWHGIFEMAIINNDCGTGN